MNVAGRLGAFAVALVAVFAAAYGAGSVAGPGVGGGAAHDMADDRGASSHGTAHGSDQAAATVPGGLAVSADGYTLRQLSGAPAAGQPGEYAFQIVDSAGAPLTRFQTSHDKLLHLIVVRRDLTGFQHLHPESWPDGTWRTPLTLPDAGDWRVFADFRPDGHDGQVILGLDVPVAGGYRPQPLPEPAETGVVDEYAVRVDGVLAAGRTSRLTLTVTRGGRPVTDLQSYLGAYGHLVALRAGDLAYLHVHPQESAAAGPAIVFDVEVPSAGTYRLFLDFRHGDVVRTVPFTGTAT